MTYSNKAITTIIELLIALKSHPEQRDIAIPDFALPDITRWQSSIDLKVTGDRIYVSFFDERSRDQIAKFMSPPVIMAILKDTSEVGYECFGFHMQQCTDSDLLIDFTSTLKSQLKLFFKHPSIRKGKVFYDEMIG